MPHFTSDGLQFHYRSAGEGLPFVFQHGLGGDVDQPFDLFTPPPGIRLLAVDCRAHGETRPVGDETRISLAAFADDLAAWLDHLDIPAAVLGGISMGAAVAVNFALYYPERLRGLVLSRPAWLTGPNPYNKHVYGLIARLIHRHGARQGLEEFLNTEEYQTTKAFSPDSAQSLVGQFQHPRAEETVVRLERIPQDSACSDLSELAGIGVPTLVLANRQDPIHPYEYGETLARVIRDAELGELTPKSVDRERHGRDVQRLIGQFLQKHFL